MIGLRSAAPLRAADRDPAQLGELLERRATSEAAEAGRLDSAERHLRLVVDGGAVDVADAGLEPAGHVEGPRHVAAEDGARQPVLGVVGDADGLVDAVDRDDGDDRAEGLLGVEAHRRRHARQHGGRVAEAVGRASAEHRGAVPARVLDEIGDALDRRRVDHRPDLGRRLTRIADDQSGGAIGQPGAEVVGHRAVDDDALGRHADLALVEERAEVRRRGGLVEVGVVEHHHRRLAAELEQHALEVLARLLGDDPPHAGRAGEVDPPDQRMRDQLVDDLRRVGRLVDDQVHDARPGSRRRPARARSRHGPAGTPRTP